MDQNNSNLVYDKDVILEFKLNIISSNLSKTTHYNSYQQKLYRLIKFLKEERNLGYRRISYILNEKNYRSIRSNKILKGREYEFGVNDCFEAMRDYLALQNIKIPSRAAFEDDWWEKGLDYFTDEIIKDYGYTRVEGNMQANDVIIFTINASVGNHCGVYLGDDVFFHHAENRISCRENLYPFWKQHISGVYRYAT